MSKTSRAWKRIGLQLGILAGAGLALVGGVEPSRAGPVCLEEGQCTITKPIFLIALDYSTAMNEMFDADETRWQRAVAAVQAVINGSNGLIPGNSMLALMRFGHDPDADQPGTTIVGDASGLVDGHKLDVPWYDVLDPGKSYYQCNGEAVLAALAATPPPLAGAPAGIGAWTGGAMARAKALFAQAKADHPDEVGPEARKAALIVITQGVWTDQENTQVLQPPAADPAPVAWDMFANDEVATYVFSVGDAAGKVEADKLAAAGATDPTLVEPDELTDALKWVLQAVVDDVPPPICEPRRPRIMFILDGSSSMLNVMGDSVHGAMGQTRWDLLRTGGIAQALSGTTPPLNNAVAIETWSIVGAAVFGDDSPAEQKLLVDYAPCRADVLDWALDPQTSCEAPGCVDPWGGPPLAWTFKTDEIELPQPTTTVQSHVPRCDPDPQKPGACSGSGAFVHLGLELVQGHLVEARASCMDFNTPNLCDAQTKFYNVLIMDGTYDSDDAAVQASLEQMMTDGVRTYVLGLGELAETPEAVEQLTMMAAWGSGGALDFFPAGDSQVELQAAFAAIFEHMFDEVTQIPIDPCCGGLGCGWLDGGEEDGQPDPSDSDGTSSTTGETSSTTDTPVTSTTSTGATTDGPTSTATSGATTDAPTSGGPTTDAPTSGGPTTGAPTTDEPTTGELPGTGTPGESGDEPTGTDTDGGAPGAEAQDGCGCTSGAEGEGTLASLLGLGLLGMGRRRRRTA